MQTLNSFLIVTTLAFAFLAIIWNRKDWFNFSLKFLFIVLLGWSLFLLLVNNGYLVKQTAPTVTKEAPAPKPFERNQPGPFTK